MAPHDSLTIVASIIIIAWGASFLVRRLHAKYAKAKNRKAWDRQIADGGLISRVRW